MKCSDLQARLAGSALSGYFVGDTGWDGRGGVLGGCGSHLVTLLRGGMAVTGTSAIYNIDSPDPERGRNRITHGC